MTGIEGKTTDEKAKADMYTDTFTQDIVEKAYQHRIPFFEADEEKRVSAKINMIRLIIVKRYRLWYFVCCLHIICNDFKFLHDFIYLERKSPSIFKRKIDSILRSIGRNIQEERWWSMVLR